LTVPAGLPQTAHPAHAVEERGGEAFVAEQMIVEESRDGAQGSRSISASAASTVCV
jgi:hypothetical protein